MTVRTITLAGGLEMPVLGQGTWRMGEDPSRRPAEVFALQLGIDLGMTLIDTAEMYADAEAVVADAIRGRRDEVSVVSKVLPQNASRRGTVQACERSLGKLGIETIDLYLLHWSGSHPLSATLDAFEELREGGKIRAWGVSNFDTSELAGACALAPDGRVASNQILYNLARRGPEAGLLAQCRDAGISVMAYSPLEQARMDFGGALAEVAARHGATPAQVAIAWTLRFPWIVSIPKAADAEHVRENAGSIDVRLGEDDLAELDAAFPRRGSALEWL